MLNPVLQRLSQRSDIEVTLLALTTAQREFNNPSFPVYGYKDFFTSRRALRYGKCLNQATSEKVDSAESIAYLGQNFLELRHSSGSHNARHQYRKLGRQAFLPVRSLQKILQTVQPKLLLTTNVARSEQAAVLAASALGVRTVALIDMFAIRCLPWFREPGFADMVGVLSAQVKDQLIAAGRPADHIEVTGNPAFDEQVKHYNANQQPIREKRNQLPFTVLWASQVEPSTTQLSLIDGDPELPRKVEKQLLKIAYAHPDWQLIFRHHPNELPPSYPDTVRVSPQSEDISALLEQVDVVITLTSTLGFQAALMGARLITLDLSVFTPTMPFTRYGISQGISDLDHLECQLIRCESEVDAQPLPPYQIANAAKRVEQLIMRTLAKK